jgi:hypothetical protein
VSVADAAPQPVAGYGLGLLCAALVCLFLVSTVMLVVVLMRRNRRGSA